MAAEERAIKVRRLELDFYQLPAAALLFTSVYGTALMNHAL